MSHHLASSAILLRTIEHGENDKIITAFTLEHGKISLIAKGAKKSQKRFGGVLEIFSALNLVWALHHKKGLPFLQEATIIHPFDKIRSQYQHMVYASHWCELAYRWMEEGKKQIEIYELLAFTLDQLNGLAISPEILHLMFQLHFMAINGFQPNLSQCTGCHTSLDSFEHPLVFFDVNRGGVLCNRCKTAVPSGSSLSKGTVKQLLWILNTPLSKIHRMRFTRNALRESFTLLEAFILHHLGKETKSMKLVKELASWQQSTKSTFPTQKKH